MLEREYRDYLYENPSLLFPHTAIDRKEKEVCVEGRFIDLLFRVAGTQYIIELKRDTIRRDAIGQVMEYYGLLRRNFRQQQYKMMLVAPSIPEFRSLPLEEFGIRCVEIPIPDKPWIRSGSVSNSRPFPPDPAKGSPSKVGSATENVPASIRFADLQPPSSRRSMLCAQSLLRDGLPGIESAFNEYEIRPVRMVKWNSPGLLYFPLVPSVEVLEAGAWWAYSFGPLEHSAKNDVPNISVNALPWGLDVAVNAELQPSQKILFRNISRDSIRFDRLIAEHNQLEFQAWFKLELQPRIYHWVLVDQQESRAWDSNYILKLQRCYVEQFGLMKTQWRDYVERHGPKMTNEQSAHLSKMNQKLNLCIRLVDRIPGNDPLWRVRYEEQIAQLAGRYGRLKPLIDFFHS